MLMTHMCKGCQRTRAINAAVKAGVVRAFLLLHPLSLLWLQCLCKVWWVTDMACTAVGGDVEEDAIMRDDMQLGRSQPAASERVSQHGTLWSRRDVCVAHRPSRKSSGCWQRAQAKSEWTEQNSVSSCTSRPRSCLWYRGMGRVDNARVASISRAVDCIQQCPAADAVTDNAWVGI